jgi:hypothetical protein
LTENLTVGHADGFPGFCPEYERGMFISAFQEVFSEIQLGTRKPSGARKPI